MSKKVLLIIASLAAVGLLSLVAAQCGATPTPERIVETVVVTKEVAGEKVTVIETVIVEKTVEVTVPVEKKKVTIAYNGYFNKTFGPADVPIKAIQTEVGKKYPDISVDMITTPYEAGAWRDIYLTWFTAEDGTADLLGVSTYWEPEFVESGWLVPLEDKVSPAILDKIIPAYKDAFSYKGHLYVLGPWWGGIGGLYYRKDLLEKYGFQPPKTYDDIVNIVKAIKAKEPTLHGWDWPALKDLVLVNRWVEYLNGYGGKYFDDAGKCAMNDEKGVAALTFMKSLIAQGITPKEALTWKEEESIVSFLSGQAIFLSGRQDLLFYIDDPAKSKVAGKWGFIPNVATAEGKPAGFFEPWGFAINKFSKNQDTALKVLEVMFDFPVQKAFNLSQGPLQANMDVYKDPDVIKNNPNMPLIEAVAQTAKPAIPSANFSDIASILQEELSSGLAGIKTPKVALDDACKRIDEIPAKTQ